MLWHVTSRRHRDGIAGEGLRSDAMGWDTGHVWAFDDLDVARTSAATDRWGGQLPPHDIWAIDATGLEVLPDPHPGWGDGRDQHSRAIPHSVGPARLRLVHATDPAPAG